LEVIPHEKDLGSRFDFVICLGGDGTLLHMNTLFPTKVPPILAFNMGSLGFLTPFCVNNFKEDIRTVVRGGYLVTDRMRLEASIYQKGKDVTTFHVLNEVVIDRGDKANLSKLNCFVNGTKVTTIQADGVIIATSTGSTAYSLSAGGSMIHPLVPAMIMTPICPHSLSFRPVVLPDTVVLKIQIPDRRPGAYVAFDGRDRKELLPGDYIEIRKAIHSVQTYNMSNQIDDWFKSLVNCLHWNNRDEQI